MNTPQTGGPDAYTSIPVTIEARRWDGTIDSGRAIIDWAGEAEIRWTNETPQRLRIYTLEGEMAANPGDWIIKGTLGEYYPCKDAVFQAKYRPHIEPVPVDQKRLFNTDSALVWAEEFCKMNPGADESTMTAWFANAIETAKTLQRHSATNWKGEDLG